MEADIAVLDLQATPLMAHRTAGSASVPDMMFALMTLGGERAIRATYVAGECVYDRDAAGDQFSYPGT